MDEERVEKVLGLVQSILNGTATDDADMNWMLLNVTLTPSGDKIPVVRSPKLASMLQMGLQSDFAPFKELTFNQLVLQLPYPGSNDYILSLPSFPLLLEALDDSNGKVASQAMKILLPLCKEILLSQEYATAITSISKRNEQSHIRVYSFLFQASSNSEEVFRILVEHEWISSFLAKLLIQRGCDIIAIMNLLEILTEFMNAITTRSNSFRLLVWNAINHSVLSLVQTLSDSTATDIPFDLFFPMVLKFATAALLLFLELQKENVVFSSPEHSNFAKAMIPVLERNVETSSEVIIEAIITTLGCYSHTLEAQAIFLATPVLCAFYKNSILHNSKAVYLSFIASVRASLTRSKGGKEGYEFLKAIGFSSSCVGLTLKYAKSPYLAERVVIYQLWQELAAILEGRDLLLSTDGWFMWMKSRDQMVQVNPEAIWRYSIFKQLISSPAQCKDKLGDSGYLQIKEYLSDGPYYTSPEYRVAMATGAD